MLLTTKWSGVASSQTSERMWVHGRCWVARAPHYVFKGRTESNLRDSDICSTSQTAAAGAQSDPAGFPSNGCLAGKSQINRQQSTSLQASVQASALSGLASFSSIGATTEYEQQGKPVRTVSTATRRKLSLAAKARWKDPERKAAMIAKQKGKVPWNKGKTFGPETRVKMSQAKLLRRLTPATRRKISVGLKGRKVSQEAADAFAARMRGIPKTQEHRNRIAASQRKRIAARRVLQAVKTVGLDVLLDRQPGPAELDAAQAQTAALVEATDPGPADAPPASTVTDMATALGLPIQTRSQAVGAAASPAAQRQVLEGYRAQLREYRDLQAELNPWVSAFREQHGRKPCLADIEATGIPWLVEKYQEYVILRDKILADTYSIRSKLEGPKAPGSLTRALGALTKVTPRSEAGARVHQALEYKRQKQAAATAAALGKGAGTAQPSAVSAGAVAGQAPGAAAVAGPMGKLIPKAPPNASPRVRAALQAAAEYREKQRLAASAAVPVTPSGPSSNPQPLAVPAMHQPPASERQAAPTNVGSMEGQQEDVQQAVAEPSTGAPSSHPPCLARCQAEPSLPSVSQCANAAVPGQARLSTPAAAARRNGVSPRVASAFAAAKRYRASAASIDTEAAGFSPHCNPAVTLGSTTSPPAVRSQSNNAALRLSEGISRPQEDEG